LPCSLHVGIVFGKQFVSLSVACALFLSIG
jgi:hypothetical protein